MPLVMLKPNWPSGSFFRTVKTAAEDVVRLEFQKGQPVDVAHELLDQLAGDIGHALVLSHTDDKGRPRVGEPPAAASSGEVPPTGEPQPPADPPPNPEVATNAPHAGRRSGGRRK